MSLILRRRILPVLTAGLVAVAVAGCAKIDMNLSIAGDTVSGRLVTALDQEAAEQLELSPDDMFGEQDVGLAPLPGVTAEPYQDDTWTGTAYTFDRVRLDDLNQLADDSPDGPRITRDLAAGTYTFEMVMDLAFLAELEEQDPGDDPDAPDFGELLDRFEAVVVVTFPGTVTSHNGDVLAGSTVTWRPPAGERTELRAVALAPDEPVGEPPPGADPEAGDPGTDATGGGSEDGTSLTAVVLLVGLGVVVLAAAGLGASWLVRRRQPVTAPLREALSEFGTDRPPEEAPGGEPGGAPGGEEPTKRE